MFKKNHVYTSLVVLGLSSLGTSVCQAAGPLDVSTDITIDSVHDCTLTVKPVASSVALKYALSDENLEDNTAGTYTISSGDGYAKYIVSAGATTDCAFTGLAIRLPTLGTATAAAKSYSRSLKVGDAELYVNSFLADFYATASADGTGTQVDIAGAKYSRNTSTSSSASLTRNPGSWAALTAMAQTQSLMGAVTTPVLSTVGNVVDDGYAVNGYAGWPRYPTGSISTLPVGFINGAQSGAYVNIPGTSLDGQKSVTVDIGVAVASKPVVGSAEDVGSVVNGDVFTGNGTVTVTTL